VCPGAAITSMPGTSWVSPSKGLNLPASGSLCVAASARRRQCAEVSYDCWQLPHKSIARGSPFEGCTSSCSRPGTQPASIGAVKNGSGAPFVFSISCVIRTFWPRCSRSHGRWPGARRKARDCAHGPSKNGEHDGSPKDVTSGPQGVFPFVRAMPGARTCKVSSSFSKFD
jgi:hypothetical protein